MRGTAGNFPLGLITMLLNNLNQLNPSDRQAVIINVSTKLVTTLALLSAVRYAAMPILVIDCESADGSLEHFTELMKIHDFDLLSAPLKKHGETLNWLFNNIPAEKVLLIDSDVEILSSEIIRIIGDFIDEDRIFGGGFTHGPCWLSDHQGVGYYQERMWIPLTMLRVSHVREALANGNSFADRTIFNDVAASNFISRVLARRFGNPSLKNWRLSWLDGFKASYYGVKPAYVYCDTGADIFQFLKYQKGLYFAGFPAELHGRYATHFHGVTRSLLDPQDANSTSLANIAEQVRQRLREVYEFSE